MKLNGVQIEDTFAEVFHVYISRILITALTKRLALGSAMETKGLGRSATLPPSEASIECYVKEKDTPDSRPGYIIQVSDQRRKELEYWLVTRIRKGVVPIPTSAVYDALPSTFVVKDFVEVENTPVQLFGDGYEEIINVYGKKMYKIPRMDGFLLVEKRFGMIKGIAGGNLFVLGDSQSSTLAASEKALEAIMKIPYITGRVSASGSKVGGNYYKSAVATTNHLYCTCISNRVKNSKIPDNVHCVYELIINGLTLDNVKQAMKAGIEKASQVKGIKKITAGNYGGKLGKEHIYLSDLIN